MDIFMNGIEGLTYKKEFERSFIIMPFIQEKSSRYELKMITQNKIPGFLSCKIRQDEDGQKLYYDVTSKKTIEEEYRDRQMSYVEMKELLLQIGKMIRGAGEYLLNTSQIWFYPQCMFMDFEMEELYGLYCPYETPDTQAEISIPRIGKYHALADFLLDKINHKDEQAVNAAYKFYKMSKEAYFSFEDFLTLLEKDLSVPARKEKGQEEKDISTFYTEEESIKYGLPEEYPPKEEEAHMISVKWPAVFLGLGILMEILYMALPLNGSMWWIILVGGLTCIVMAILLFVKEVTNFIKYQKEKRYDEPEEVMSIDEFFSGEEGKTVFFQPEEEISDLPMLHWKENGKEKTYSIKKFPLIIGKQKNETDVYVEDASVSRKHARISRKSGQLWIEDMESTNGTFVNHEKIYPGEEHPFKAKDEIRIGKIIIDVV